MDFFRKRRCVEGDAVFDGPFYSARLIHFAVADFFDAGWVEDFEVLERVAVDDDEVGFVADSDAA